MELMDNEVTEKFTGDLKNILKLELKAGNKIQEIFQGDWPLPNSIIILLKIQYRVIRYK